MSLVKFKKRRFPYLRDGLSTWLDTDEFFADDFFSDEQSFPPMNVKENENTFEIELVVPGFSKKEIDVSMENNMLLITAEKQKEEVEDNVEGYTRREFNYNEFERKIKLPTTVNLEEKIKAIYKEGILKLVLAKKEGQKEVPKKIIEIS